MKTATTQELIEILTKNRNTGYQLSKRHGLLNSTKCIYLKATLVYLFDISEEFIFDTENGYEVSQFISAHADVIWIIEDPIS
jgi:hypothetical protein